MHKLVYTRFFVTSMVLVLMGASGCTSGHKTATSKTQSNRKLCAEEWLSFPDQPHPIFEKVDGLVADAPADMPLPKKYIRYKVSEDTLKALFNHLKTTSGKTGIIIPIDTHCEPFEIKVSGAMATALQGKYPEMASIQGKGINNKAADIRLDWNGKQLRGQVTYNGVIYFIAGLTENNETTYLFYKREDSGETKQPFEAKPNTTRTNQVYYDR